VVKSLETEPEFIFNNPKVLGGHIATLFEGLACGLVSANIDSSSQIVSVEFDPDINREERDQLFEAFQQIDSCQRRLDNFQGM